MKSPALALSYLILSGAFATPLEDESKVFRRQVTAQNNVYPYYKQPKPSLSYIGSSANKNFEKDARGVVEILVPPPRNFKTQVENNNDPSTICPVASDPNNLDTYKAIEEDWFKTSRVRINRRNYPEDNTYDKYIADVEQACVDNSGLFDIVWLNSTVAGRLSDCLLDLWEWDENIAADHDSVAVWSNVVNKRLVGVPAENSFGIYYYNMGLFKNIDLHPQHQKAEEFEEFLNRFKSMTEFVYPPVTASLKGEGLMAALTEWMASVNGSSMIDHSGNVTVSSSDVGNSILRLEAFGAEGLIKMEEFGEFDDNDAYKKWMNQQALYLRHWSSTYLKIKSDAAFDWKLQPIASYSQVNNYIGTYNGWSMGVFKGSKNPSAAVKLVKWMTSKEYQRRVINETSNPPIPTYDDLFDDPDVQRRFGEETSALFKSINLRLRPSNVVSNQYNRVCNLVTNSVTPALKEEIDVRSMILKLDSDLRKLLGLKLINGTGPNLNENIPISGKKVPKNVGTQSLILAAIITLTVGGIVIRRRLQFRQERKEKDATEQNQESSLLNRNMPEMSQIPEKDVDESNHAPLLVAKSAIP